MAHGIPPSTSVRITSEIKSSIRYARRGVQFLTKIIDVKTGFVERTGVKFKTDDCKNYDCKKQEEGNIDKGSDGLGNG